MHGSLVKGEFCWGSFSGDFLFFTDFFERLLQALGPGHFWHLSENCADAAMDVPSLTLFMLPLRFVLSVSSRFRLHRVQLGRPQFGAFRHPNLAVVPC